MSITSRPFLRNSPAMHCYVDVSAKLTSITGYTFSSRINAAWADTLILISWSCRLSLSLCVYYCTTVLRRLEHWQWPRSISDSLPRSGHLGCRCNLYVFHLVLGCCSCGLRHAGREIAVISSSTGGKRIVWLGCLSVIYRRSSLMHDSHPDS